MWIKTKTRESRHEFRTIYAMYLSGDSGILAIKAVPAVAISQPLV